MNDSLPLLSNQALVSMEAEHRIDLPKPLVCVVQIGLVM